MSSSNGVQVTADNSPDALGDSGSAAGTAAQKHGLLSRLYTGTGAFEIVGRRRMFYALAAVIVAICVGSMVFRGFTLGIDFEGGTRVALPAGSATTSEVEDVYAQTLGMDPVAVQTVGSGNASSIQIRSESLDITQATELRQALFDRFQPKDSGGNPNINEISDAAVSETWGGEITKKALIALVVFLVLVSTYIAVRFERDMAIAAVAALFFDIAATAGVYSLVGFEVTPATVIGLLTILGFSLYDTVVVFDKVEENTRGVLNTTRRTYAEQANLAVNQTLMRSINTTVISVLPVIGLMVVAVWLLGVGTLKDLALVQLVGIIVGAFSSVFFATPLLVSLKERRGPVVAHTKKVLARRNGSKQSGRSVAVDMAKAPAGAAGSAHGGSPATRRTAPRPGGRPAGKPSGKRKKR